MKWSPTGWGARIKDSQAKGGSYVIPVERWSRWANRAMVTDAKSGKLIPATQFPGYVELVPLHRVVAVVSAAPGWTANAHAFGQEPAYTTPIAAWVMDGEGDFWPVAAEGYDPTGEKTNPDPRGEHTLSPQSSSRLRILGPAQP